MERKKKNACERNAKPAHGEKNESEDLPTQAEKVRLLYQKKEKKPRGTVGKKRTC